MLVGSTIVVGYGNYLAPEEVKGVVVKVDGASLVVELKDGKQETIPVQAETVVRVDGKEGRIENLKPKQPVAITRWRDEVRTIDAGK